MYEEVDGVEARLLFDGAYVTVTPAEWLANETTTRIPLESITKIDWAPGSSYGNGYIQLVTTGDVEPPPIYDPRGEPVRFLVSFAPHEMPRFERFRDALKKAMYGRPEPDPIHGLGPTAGPEQAAAQLRQLEHLKDTGVLPLAEYHEKRADVIARMQTSQERGDERLSRRPGELP